MNQLRKLTILYFDFLKDYNYILLEECMESYVRYKGKDNIFIILLLMKQSRFLFRM